MFSSIYLFRFSVNKTSLRLVIAVRKEEDHFARKLPLCVRAVTAALIAAFTSAVQACRLVHACLACRVNINHATENVNR